ncbi:MAG: alpha/beta fold hydrolase, partial [Desulfobacteraceae bacterium]|nr:alpha/beta fold hydrolase [Desulfobacteraceae bacterium]
MIRIRQKIKTSGRSFWKKMKRSCNGITETLSHFGKSRFLLMTTWLMMLILFYSCASLNLSDYKEFSEEPRGLDLFYKYQKINADRMKKINFEQTYDPSVRESNYSKIMYGNNDTAVILLHGFISSPFEVYFLANEINKSDFTVYLPLVEGFGGGIDFANATRYSSWQLTLKKSIEKLAPNYRNIILVGFSMGGTIVTDFLLKNNYDGNKIQGAILIAPYFAPKWSAGQWLSKGIGLFSDSVSLKTLYQVCRSNDLIIPLSNQ